MIGDRISCVLTWVVMLVQEKWRWRSREGSREWMHAFPWNCYYLCFMRFEMVELSIPHIGDIFALLVHGKHCVFWWDDLIWSYSSICLLEFVDTYYLRINLLNEAELHFEFLEHTPLPPTPKNNPHCDLLLNIIFVGLSVRQIRVLSFCLWYEMKNSYPLWFHKVENLSRVSFGAVFPNFNSSYAKVVFVFLLNSK